MRDADRSGTERAFTTNPWVKIGWCEPCDKCIYLSRKTARIAARQLSGANRPRPYLCPAGNSWWHLGHLPDDVRRGVLDRPEYVRRKGLAEPS